jgi:hypothetical protein
MLLFYDFVNKEFNILPSENFNKTIEITNYEFNAYSTDTDFVYIDNLDDFYKMVNKTETKEKKDTKVYHFKDRLKNKYKIIQTTYNEYNLYQFMIV